MLNDRQSVGLARAARGTGLVLLMALACASQARAQALPPIPKAATPSKGARPEPMAPMPQEIPLLAAGPKDLPKADKPCAALPDKGADWIRGALGTLQAQSLRPNGVSKARDAYAELWIFFLSARAKGYDLDAYSNKVDALYVGLYPSGAFAASSPFEKFKEPRRTCKKAPGAP